MTEPGSRHAAHPDVGESPLILGYAGLLPQTAAAATCCFETAGDMGALFAFGYATLILSFLGGIWWGFAMGVDRHQGRIALVAVLPSLFCAALILLMIGHVVPLGMALALLGSGVIATLMVDRRLAADGIAPRGWMTMRVPLSLGLGGLTILCGIVLALR